MDEAEKRFLQGVVRPIDEQLDNARQVFGRVKKSRQLLEISGIGLESRKKTFSLKQKLNAAWQVVSTAGQAI